MQMQPHTPVISSALLAALDTPTHSLRRGPGGFIAVGQPIKKSGPVPYQAFTRRAIKFLEREGLAEFDVPEFPSVVTLTEAGVAAARELKAAMATRTVKP